MSIWSVAFWKAAGERAGKTAAQAALLAIMGSGALSTAQVNAFSVDWATVAGFTAGGAVLSLLTSMVSNRFGPYYGPSLTDEAVMIPDVSDE